MKKFLAWLLAFLLTGSLLLFCVSFLFRRTVAPAVNESARMSEQVISTEKELIRENVENLAAVYGFSAEPVIASVDDETLRDLNEQATEWWSSLLADGKAGMELYLDTSGIRKILLEDPLLSEQEDLDAYIEMLAGEISKSIRRVVLPMRQETIQIGVKEANKRVDIVNLVVFFLDLPWAALALAALLAGLIALLECRRISRCLKYIGSAAGAAALILIVIAALACFAGIQPMIREASRSLAVQYTSVLNGILLTTGFMTAVLLAACVISLILYRRCEKNV